MATWCWELGCQANAAIQSVCDEYCRSSYRRNIPWMLRETFTGNKLQHSVVADNSRGWHVLEKGELRLWVMIVIVKALLRLGGSRHSDERDEVIIARRAHQMHPADL